MILIMTVHCIYCNPNDGDTVNEFDDFNESGVDGDPEASWSMMS